jgi:hypothetical protein
MQLSAAELDCLIVSLKLREDRIGELRASGELPPEVCGSCLDELAALRVKLTAELDRLFAMEAPTRVTR